MKRKMNRLLVFSIFTIVGSIFFMSTVDATIVNISAKVPSFQQYGYVRQAEKSKNGKEAAVDLWVMQNEAVTFSVKSVGDGTYGRGTTVKYVDVAYTINYSKEYAKGEQVQARYRNHNWTPNSGQMDGYFDYQ